MDYVSNLVDKANEFIEKNDGNVVEKKVIEWLSILMILSAFIVAAGLLILKYRVKYGRYCSESALGEYSLDSRIGWIIQESPSLIIAALAYFRMPGTNWNVYNFFAVSMFVLHYFQRTVIYSYLIKSGKTLPIHCMLAGVVFTSWNGYIQGHYHALYSDFDESFTSKLAYYIGAAIFFVGFFINIDSDARLRSLRKDSNDHSYKIPRGGIFEYVSGANFFGEILEWFGYAIFCRTLPAFAFSLFTVANTMPRALDHHNWYLKKFEDYPKDRKAVFPFLL